MTRSKQSDLHPYDPEVGRTFHRLSRNNRSVVVHDSVVLDSSIVHTNFTSDFIPNFVFEPTVSAFESGTSVELIKIKLLRNWLHLMLCINLGVFNILRLRLVMS